jgi:hypothetical protein
VKAFAARSLEKALELDAAQPVADIAGGRHQVFPGDTGTRIEVEDQPVGVLAFINGGSSRVDFEHAALDQCDEAIDVVHGNNLIAFFRDHVKILGRYSGAGVLLEETLA